MLETSHYNKKFEFTVVNRVKRTQRIISARGKNYSDAKELAMKKLNDYEEII